MRHEKLLRDPVHDLIIFDRDLPEDRLLLRVMDTPEVQRLRRIKQLGMAHMAYQGAEHSRFSHSMGVLHLTRRMLDRLAHDQPVSREWKLATQLAGLLHDLGHGPFSHVMEKFFREHHETWTERIILAPDTGVNRLLTEFDRDLPRMVVDALHGRAEPLWLNHIISSQMDADRFDYLLRDSHMTGVKYGIFDLERLLMLLRVGSTGDRIVVSTKGVLPVEKYLQSRYQMYRQVYFHKTVTAAEAMLMGVLSRARDMSTEGEVPHVAPGTPLAKLLSHDTITVDEFLALDDSVLYNAMNLWSRCGDSVLKDLSTRLLTRHLFKSVEVQRDEAEEDLLFSSRLRNAQDFLDQRGLDHRYYLRFSRSSDTPYRPYGSRGGKAVIWLEDDRNPGEYTDIKEVSPTIRAFTESPYTIIRAFFPDMAGTEPIRASMTHLLMG